MPCEITNHPEMYDVVKAVNQSGPNSMVANINQLIEGVEQLETPELETYVAKVNLLLAKRRVPRLLSKETELLQAINQSLPPEIENRYSELQDKVHDETITPTEHEELMKLIDVTELADAQRLQAMITLAQLRQIPLPKLMEQLGIYPPPVRG